MGHSQAAKQQTHDRIVEIASKRLREQGLEGIGVADLMKEAGLTVGGFYKHFASRDELVAEAMQMAFGSWEARMKSQGRVHAEVPLDEYAANYMSANHRDDTAGGCPFAALAADLARGNEEWRVLATSQMKTNLANMMARVDASDEEEARRKAIILSCVMTGAIGLARIASDKGFSNEIIETVEDFAKSFGEK